MMEVEDAPLMPSAEYVELQVPAGSATGTPRKVGTVYRKTVQVSGLTGGSIQLQGQIGDLGFENLGAAIVADGFTLVEFSVDEIRAVSTAVVGSFAGTARAAVLGAY